MTIQQEKTELQQSTVYSAVEARKALVIFPTGLGKCKIGIDFLDSLYQSGIRNNYLIVFPFEKIKKSWTDELKIWNKEYLLTKIKFICYNSLYKEQNTNYSAIILDEVHHITEPNVIGVSANTEYILGLTATVPRHNGKRELIYSRLGLKVVGYMELDEAIRRGFVSPFRFILVKTSLNKTVKNVEAGSKNQRFLTTEKANYDWLSKMINSYRDKIGGTNYYQVFLRKRLHFMNNLPSKIAKAKEILSAIGPDKRVVVFSKSIASANAIHPYTYHSKSGNKNYELFMDGKINVLSVVGAINEGVTIPDIDAIVISQLNSSDLTLIQIIGRLIRFKPNFQGDVYVIVAEDCVDMDWFFKAKGDMPYVEYEDLRAMCEAQD